MINNINKSVKTSIIGLYLWRLSYGIIIAILSSISIFIIISKMSYINGQVNNNIENEPMKMVFSFIFIGLIVLVDLMLFKAVLFSRHLTINDNGIRFEKRLIKWNNVNKVVAYRAFFPLISIRLKSSQPKKIIGILPFLYRKIKINILSDILSRKGVEFKRWWI